MGLLAAAAATTLGVMGFFDRERIGRWFADESDSKERKQGRLQDAAGVLETAESLKKDRGEVFAVPGQLLATTSPLARRSGEERFYMASSPLHPCERIPARPLDRFHMQLLGYPD